MRKLSFLLCLFLWVLNSSCGRTGLKKYYTKISPEEFASYDSTSIVANSKYGVVYRAFSHTASKLSGNFKIDFLVFEKYTGGKRSGLFKLDELAEIRNDSTFIFYGNPLKIVADTSNWVKGIWFYEQKNNGTEIFKIDSMPRNLPPLNLQQLTMGIYLYKAEKLVRVSDSQSEEALNNLNMSGFFYLPNPGRFYMLASFNQIE